MTGQKSQPSSPVARRRRRPTGRDDVPVLPGAEEAQDATLAQDLVDDVLALIDAGLIAPIRGLDGVRYAVVDEPPTAA
jgi:hypothetical protein